MIQVVVIASSLAGRAGLRALLSIAEQVEIIREATALAEIEGLAQPPDIYVILSETNTPLNWDMLARQSEPLPGVLLLSNEVHHARSLSRLPLRGWALLPTDCSEGELLGALFAIDQGLVAGTAALFNTFFEKKPTLQEDSIDPQSDLTDRELEVLALLAEGLANKQISLRLGISEHTVKFHVSSIYTKLGVSSRAEAVRLGIQLGLVMI